MRSPATSLKFLFVLALAAAVTGPLMLAESPMMRGLISLVVCILAIGLAIHCLAMKASAAVIVPLLVGIAGLVVSQIATLAFGQPYMTAHADGLVIGQAFVLLALLCANHAARGRGQAAE